MMRVLVVPHSAGVRQGVYRTRDSRRGVPRGADGIEVARKEQVPMRADLLELFERDELAKYLTDAELPEGAA